MQRVRVISGDGNNRHAQLGTFPSSLKIVQHQFGAVDRHGEPDADVAAVRPQNRGIDSHHVARRIEQRTAAVTGIDSGVSLDQPFQRPFVFATNATPQRTDDAGGQRAIQPERIADGEYFLADLQRRRNRPGGAPAVWCAA